MRPRLAIVGGGVAGWALALALRRLAPAGRASFGPVHLYEGARSLARHQGYSLTMQQARERFLQPMRLDAQCREQGRPTGRGFTTLSASDGRVIFSAKGAPKPERAARANYALPREALRATLHCAVTEDDHAQVFFGHRLLGVQPCALEEGRTGVALQFQTVESPCSIVQAGAVVFADGLWSTGRRLLLPEEPATYAGVRMINGICSMDHPLVNSAVLEVLDGKGARLFVKPFDRTRVMWQFTHTHEVPQAQLRSAMKPELPSDFEALIQARDFVVRSTHGWPVPAPWVASTGVKNMRVGLLYDRPPLPAQRWASAAEGLEGHCTFLGDAAHPMTPFKGQGANNAFVDAVELTEAVYQHETLERAFRAYERSMAERTRASVLDSRRLTELTHQLGCDTRSKMLQIRRWRGERSDFDARCEQMEAFLRAYPL